MKVFFSEQNHSHLQYRDRSEDESSDSAARTCLYEVVADVGFSDHWQYVRLTPLHGLTPPTDRIDQ